MGKTKPIIGLLVRLGWFVRLKNSYLRKELKGGGLMIHSITEYKPKHHYVSLARGNRPIHTQENGNVLAEVEFRLLRPDNRRGSR